MNPLKDLKSGKSNDIDSYLNSMIHNGERMVQLINQLLELSKLDHGVIEIEHKTFELNAFLNVLIQSFESWTLQKQIHFNYQVPDEIIYVSSDYDKLEKIFSNLISNAIKNTPANGRIKIIANLNPEFEKPNQGKLNVIIHNSNSFIPVKKIPEIFNRYFSSEAGGMGIGLALTKELVELLEGEISVESNEVSGTVFTVEIPLLQGKPNANYNPQVSKINIPNDSNTNVVRTSNDWSRQTLLVVEDNLDLQLYMKNNLKANYNVLQAMNGKTGLELAIKEIPDLIISDTMMPEMDGFSFVKLLKEETKTDHIPIIMLTARSGHQDKLSGIELGIDSYMTKPFDMAELHIQIKNKLDQQQRLRHKFSKTVIYVPKDPADTSNPESFLNKAVAIVLKHLDDEQFSGDKLANQMAVSSSQLYRKLKSTTDHSPAIFIRKIRLQKAHELLEHKKGNISEISFSVGIPNLAYFSRTFSKEYGYPPSKLLKKNQINP